MNAYVVADQRWAFGRNGGLLFSLPADLDRFHTLTRNGTVIMGPERLEFFTGGSPLPQRRNIVVTRDPSHLPEGAEGVSSPEKALTLAGGPEAENLWIIGERHRVSLSIRAVLEDEQAAADAEAENADTFFPNLDKLPNWEVAGQGEPMEENGLKFRFFEYVNTKLGS